jgi:hypothetical protein
MAAKEAETAQDRHGDLFQCARTNSNLPLRNRASGYALTVHDRA